MDLLRTWHTDLVTNLADSWCNPVQVTICDPQTPTEINQKTDKKKQKTQGLGDEKSTLQRSKTLINLLFRGGRRRDTSRGRSKSPSKGQQQRGPRKMQTDTGILGSEHNTVPVMCEDRLFNDTISSPHCVLVVSYQGHTNTENNIQAGLASNWLIFNKQCGDIKILQIYRYLQNQM